MALWGGIFFMTGIAAAADVSSEDQGVKKLGVVWNIAEDRRIENDGGLYQPEGLDKYMRRLVNELSERIDQLVRQNQVLEEKIDKLLQQNDALEKKISQLPSRSPETMAASAQAKNAGL